MPKLRPLRIHLMSGASSLEKPHSLCGIMFAAECFRVLERIKVDCLHCLRICHGRPPEQKARIQGVR